LQFDKFEREGLTNSLYQFHGKFVGEAENLILLSALLRPPEHWSGERKKIVSLSVLKNPTDGGQNSSGGISLHL
jgi:hypothetical protein